MSTGLIWLHLVFIVTLVISVWYNGFKIGRKNMIEQMLDDDLLDPKDVIKLYGLNKEDSIK